MCQALGQGLPDVLSEKIFLFMRVSYISDLENRTRYKEENKNLSLYHLEIIHYHFYANCVNYNIDD